MYEVQFIKFFLFWFVLFISYLRCLRQARIDKNILLHSRSSIVFWFLFGSMIHFEVIFVAQDCAYPDCAPSSFFNYISLCVRPMLRALRVLSQVLNALIGTIIISLYE